MMGGGSWFGSLVIGLMVIAHCTESLSSTEKTSTPKPETNTTAAPTAASTEAPTTKPTTPLPNPEIGSNCNASNDNDWCNYINGEAICNANNTCACATNFFQFNITVCLNVSELNPTGLNISGVTKDNLSISWNFDSGLSAIIERITVKAKHQDQASSSKNCTVDSSNTTAQCMDLTPGCTYNVTVELAVGGVTGSNSKIVHMELSNPGKLNKTHDFMAPNVTLIWGAADEQECVSLYYVSVKHGHEEKFYGTNTSAPPQIVATGLLAGTNYTAVIVSTNGNKNSTATVDWFRTVTTEPSMPQNLSSNVTGNDTIELRWSKPEKPNGDIKNYNVCYEYKRYNDSRYDYQMCKSTSDDGTNYTLTNLSAGSFYKISVKAQNEQFLGPAAYTEARTGPAKPGAVSNLNATSTDESITIYWSRPVEPNGDIVAYKLMIHNETMCEVVLNVTDTNMEKPQCSTNLTTNKSLHSFPLVLNQVNMNVTICGLKPYHNYSIFIIAYTDLAGEGEIANITIETQISPPGPVKNVSLTNKTATSVEVTWEIPEVEPGPVNYTANARSIVPGINSVPNRSCDVANYTSKFCTITGLEEFWDYEVSVIASTWKGNSTERLINFTTSPSVPSKVSSVSFKLFNDTTDRNKCNTSKIIVYWEELSVLDRNDKIVKYVVRDGNRAGQIFTQNVSSDRYNPISRNFSQPNEGLKAETSYTWQIYAVGINEGISTDFSFETKQCAPPPWNNQTHGAVMLADSSPTSVTVRMKTAFFKDNTQGKIINSSLVISKENTSKRKRRSYDAENVGAVTTWTKSSLNNFDLAYKIYLDPEDLKNVDVKIVIGSGSCYGGGDYCNGALPANTQFWVYPLVCTQVLCTLGVRFGPFATQPQPPEPPNYSGLIAGICVAFVLAALIIAFAVLWRRGVIDPIEWKNRIIRRRGSSDSDFEPIDDTDRSIPIASYGEVLEELHKDTNLQLSNQYEDIKRKGANIEAHTSAIAANLEPNKAKNRWVNILPFDHSRVKLQQLDDDDPTSDYVNANYIPGFHHKREYIATQGPLPGTIDDFWRMIWEHQVKVIVMLTLCKEGNRVKCEKYWPDEVDEPKQYGEVVVNPTSMSNMDKFDINIFTLSHGEESMKQRVTQFHYLDFPDFSANVEFDHFIDFVRTVRSHVPHNMTSPIVVHCSAGVGRTGTFIAVDYLQEYLNSPKFNLNDRVNIFDLVMRMRENRVNMVQTESQYIMIHDCFETMLEEKKESMEKRVSVNDIYVNEAFGEQEPEQDEPAYENVSMTKKGDLYANVGESNGATKYEENTEL